MPTFFSWVAILTVLWTRNIVECAKNDSRSGEPIPGQNVTNKKYDASLHQSVSQKLRSSLVAEDSNTSINGSSRNVEKLTGRSFLTVGSYHWPSTSPQEQSWVGSRANKINSWSRSPMEQWKEMRQNHIKPGPNDGINQSIYMSHISRFPQRGHRRVELNNAERRILKMHNEILLHKNQLLNDEYQWPTIQEEKLLFIPYEVHDLEPEVQSHFNEYVELFRENTCVRWVRRTHENDYVIVKASRDEKGELIDRCYSSSVGRKGGVQYIYLTTRCLGLTPGYYPALYNIPHEMMHAMGFIHEQSRLDRNCYIALTDKGSEDAYSNRRFTTIPTDMKFPYDINSVMQYRLPKAFISLQGETIGPIGEVPSWQDWSKINFLYCGAPHICDDHTSLCRRHREILKRCINLGRMQQPEDDDVLTFLYRPENKN